LLAELGEPEARQVTGGEEWLVYRAAGCTLRVRCAVPEGEVPRVASWSVSFEEGPATLREAAEPLGLWPACAPDEEAVRSDLPLIRRAVGSPGGTLRSCTAGTRDGRIRWLALFDEEPDWL
jgi:hypothetical protein